MGTLVFVCPTTGQEVSTGIEVDRTSDEDGDLLSALSQEPQAVSDLGLVGQRGSRAFGRCLDRFP